MSSPFQPFAWVNLQDPVFLKRIDHWLLVIFFPILIFLKMMNSQSDETGISDTLDFFFFFFFFCCSTMLRNFFKNFFKILCVGIWISWENKKNKVIYISTSTTTRDTSEPLWKWEILKSTEYHKRCVQLDNLFRLIAINSH